MARDNNTNTVRPGVTKRKGEKSLQIVTTDINIRSADRSPKDVGKWRNSIKSADSVINPNDVALQDIITDIQLDGHLSGILDKRADAVLNKAIFFEKDGKKVDALDKLIGHRNFRKLMRTLMWRRYQGKCGFEFLPGAEFEFIIIPPKHIKLHLGIVSTEQNGVEGISYLDEWNFWIVGDLGDLGLLTKCAPYALYKRGNIADWAQYSEIFGMPVRVIKYDATDTQTSREIDKALDESGSALVLKIPNQANFEIMDGKQSNGDGKLQDSLRIAMNNEMSVIILGNTETTTSSSSSGYAQAKEHGRQQLEVTKSDMVDMENMLNDTWFLNILKSYGYPVEGGRFVFAKEYDYTAIQSQVSIVKEVRGMGTPVGDDYIYELTGIPKPADYDAQKETQEQKRLQEKLKAKKKGTDDDDEADDDDLENGYDLTPAWKRFMNKRFPGISGFFG